MTQSNPVRMKDPLKRYLDRMRGTKQNWEGKEGMGTRYGDRGRFFLHASDQSENDAGWPCPGLWEEPVVVLEVRGKNLAGEG